MKMYENNYKDLLNSPIFENMTLSDLKSTIECINPYYKDFKKGEYIFQEGDFLDNVALLISGRIHILKNDYWGNQTLIAQINPFDIFGETFAYLINTPINVNAQAQSNSKVMFINIKKAIGHCQNNCNFHKQLQDNILNDIAKKNLYLSKKIEAVTQRTTKEKLLTYLSQESKLNNSKKFTIPFNRQELADYLAVERSAMSNEISKLVKDNIIKTSKNSFELI